ncbi:MAG: acyl-CoA dehydrogenase [Actinomycetia bacterium]|nr:acyl-CoA dehydrogenase [Actinomycetes bacterium]
MTSTKPDELPSQEERDLLRETTRDVLAKVWAAREYEQIIGDPRRLRAAWEALCQLGLSELGTNRQEGGLREIAVVMQELGRASCLAPMLSAAIVNLVLAPIAAGDERLTQLAADVAAGRSVVAMGMDLVGPSTVTVRDGKVSGTLDLVEAVDIADRLLVPLPAESSFALVDVAQPGVSSEPQRAMGASGLSRVRLDDADAVLIGLSAQEWKTVLGISRVALAARTYGEAVRPFELVVDYVKQRHQFGRPVGSFQAIHHKLANSLIALDGCSLVVEYAAESFDTGLPTWHLTAAAAFAAVGGHLRRVAMETHHAFGAIGYAEEHEAPRHTKRVHLDVLRFGGRGAARAELASHHLSGGRVPEFDLGERGNAFHDEVEAWVTEHWTPEIRTASEEYQRSTKHAYDPAFARTLGETGWFGLSWPERFGGQGRSPLEEFAFLQVMERYEAPRTGSPVHAAMLMAHGTPEQQEKYLPEILRGQALHGICYSEPDSGSDLASLRTRATRDGDKWVINGQKIWTSTYFGDYFLVAARTDPDATPKQAGISVFIVSTDAPGITKRHIATMYDGSFANVFFDDVRIPADSLLGGENNGWKVLMSALGTERGMIGGQIVLKLVRLFEVFCDHLRSDERGEKPADDPQVRDTVGALAADIEVARQLMIRCARMADNGVPPLHEAAITKVFASELHERFGEAVLDSIGLTATISCGNPGAVEDGRFELQLRQSLMWVISMGTNEIQRNLIARKGLNLPGERTRS